MTTSIYVGNLSYETTEDTVREFFSQFGKVLRTRIVNDPLTGRSRGFAFVEMDDADADKAVVGCTGKELEGRRLNVSKARPKGSPPPPGSGPRPGGPGGFRPGGPPGSFGPRPSGGSEFGPPKPPRGDRLKRREPRKEEKEGFRAKMRREQEKSKDYLKFDVNDVNNDDVDVDVDEEIEE